MQIAGCVPHACLLTAALWLAMCESPYAFLAPAILGLASDLAGAGPLGPAAAGYAVGGYAAMRLRLALGSACFWKRAVEMTVAAATMALAASLLGELAQSFSFQIALAARHALGVAIYTSVCGLPVLAILGWGQRRAAAGLG